MRWPVFAEVEAVFGERAGLFADLGQEAEGEIEFRSEVEDPFGVCGEIGVVRAKIGPVGEVRGLEEVGLDEDDAAPALGEFGDEFLVGGEEGGKALGPGEGLHLAELGKDDGNSGVGELLVPIALLPHEVEPVCSWMRFSDSRRFASSFSTSPPSRHCSKTVVTFPAEVADFQGAVGKGGDELGLEIGVEAGALDVRPAGEGDGVVGLHERLGLERAREEEEGEEGAGHGENR